MRSHDLITRDCLHKSAVMGALAFLRSVYDVGNLDTRFTTPSSVSYKTAAADARTERGLHGDRNVKPDPRAEPSKWRTPEYYIYYVLLGIIVPYMFYVAYDVSRRM